VKKLKRKSVEMLNREMHLLQHNAPVRTAVVAKEAIKKLEF